MVVTAITGLVAGCIPAVLAGAVQGLIRARAVPGVVAVADDKAQDQAQAVPA